MHFVTSLLSPLLAIFSFGASASDEISIPNCDFGEVYPASRVECQIAISNSGDKPVHLIDISPFSSKDSSGISELTVAPKSSSYIPATVDLTDGRGVTKHVFHFHSPEFDNREFRVVVQGFVLSSLDDKPELRFGVVKQKDDLTEQVVQLNSHDSSDFRIDKILESPDWIAARIGADGKTISAHIKATLQWGIRSDFLKIAINSPNQTVAVIPATADIHGEIVPSVNPIELGLLRVGGKNEFQFRLTQSDGKAFKISNINVSNLEATTKILPCEPSIPSCKLVSLAIARSQSRGVLKGKMVISFNQYAEKLNIPVSGWLVEKNFEIKSVKESDLQKSSPNLPANNSGEATADLGDKIQNAVALNEGDDPVGQGPLLRWAVSNTSEIHGFQIFRANEDSGPFVLQNKFTIPVRGEEKINTYKYRDNTAESGATYWYYVGVVYNDGHKQQLSSPQKVVAK